MSIQSEITRLSGAKSDIADAIEAKGVTVPTGTKIDGIATLIGQIYSGPGSAVTITETTDLVHGGTIVEVTGIDLSSDTVRADKLYKGFTAHDANGNAVTGTGPALVPYVIRPDAELIKTITYDKWAVADLELTLPAYSTTAQTLIASADLSPTIATDAFSDYMYYVVERFFAYPTYSVTSKAKGRVEYYFSSYLYELARQPANTIHALVDSTKFITSSLIGFVGQGFSRLIYYSGASTITSYNSTATGLYMTPVAPTYASNAITLKSPTCGFKGSGTYFSSTYFGAMTDVRYQYVFDIYRAPVGNLNIDAWGTTYSINHIVDCINTTNHKLT